MSQDKLAKYYQLCTVRMGKKAHMIDDLARTDVDVILTKKEVDLFFRQADGHYIAREIVVGGAPTYVRKPVMII